ncbi:MAG: hypothetical protein JRN59_05105 [Nitrososphaerota archaeon]|nr:hypothetical protein [Nitrososphaerota archaeon]
MSTAATTSLSQPSISGKLLVLDDTFDSIRPLLMELVKNGVPVVFWNPSSGIKPSTTNVRVILTDINLLGLETVTRGSYDDLAAKLKEIQGPFLVMFVSVNFDEEDSVKMLKEAYHDVTNKDLPGIVLGINFDKTQAQEVLSEIPARIRSVLSEQRLFSVILLSETILNQGTDRVLSEMTRKEFEAAVQALLKSIIDDTGKESVAREFVVLLSRLLTRNMESSPQYVQLKATIEDLLGGGAMSATPASESWIYNRRMYYVPDQKENHWTGDIFLTNSSNPMQQYAILITPACDISQGKKLTYYKFCYGVAVTESDLQTNFQHPIYQMDKSLGTNSTLAIQKYLKREGTPQRMYPLNHFQDNKGDDSRTLVIDLQAVQSMTPAELDSKGWTPLMRLDSPFVEDLLQKYGSYSYRLGAPSVTS